MKCILQICAFGAENPGNFIPSLLSLEEIMREKGYVTIYAFPEKAKNQSWCNNLSLDHKVYYLPEAKARILPKTYWRIKKIFKENDVIIAHSHFELYDVPVTLMASKNTKVFWHLHDAIKINYSNTNLSRKVLYKLQYSNIWSKVKILSVSEEHGGFVSKLGFKKENIVFLPNGINTDRINLSKNRPRSLNNRLLMFGWEVERKGVDVVVKATQTIKRDDYQILVVGQNACKEYLEKETTQHVVFSYPHADVNELYGSVSCFLHISRAEGMSYALLEAIYAGLPVICSDIPENGFAKNFKGVMFVKAGDPEELSFIIDSKLSELTITYEEINANRRVIENEYSLNAWRKKMIELYGV